MVECILSEDKVNESHSPGLGLSDGGELDVVPSGLSEAVLIGAVCRHGFQNTTADQGVRSFVLPSKRAAGYRATAPATLCLFELAAVSWPVSVFLFFPPLFSSNRDLGAKSIN